jgi:hypothetical protein
MINKAFKVLQFIHYTRVEYPLLAFALLVQSKLLGATALAIFLFRKLFTLGHFDFTKTHAFEPFGNPETDIISLHYKNHIPCLVLNSDDPYMIGCMHGQALAYYIMPLTLLVKCLSVFRKFPLDKIVIPEQIMQEMEGIADGYNATNPTYPIDVSTVIKWHMLPMACSSIVTNTNGNLMFGRNMDWVPYGDLAKYSILIRNEITKTYSFCIPGMVGVVTGWNDAGLILSMNVSPGTFCHGTPALFYNRLILESCRNTKEVIPFMESSKYKPFAMYHMTVVDDSDALAIAVNQGNSSVACVGCMKRKPILLTDEVLNEMDCNNNTNRTEYKYIGAEQMPDLPVSPNNKADKTDKTDKTENTDTIHHRSKSPHFIRKLIHNSHVATFNHRYENGEPTDSRFFSDERLLVKNKLIDTIPLKKLLSETPINNWITCQTLLFMPSVKKVFIGFDNGFSGSSNLSEVPM